MDLLEIKSCYKDIKLSKVQLKVVILQHMERLRGEYLRKALYILYTPDVKYLH